MTTLTVEAGRTVAPLDHFWRSTGFTPAELLLDERMKQTLTYVGSVPFGGIRHVRIHYLLNLVRAKGLGTEAVKYDWSRLDQGLDWLVRHKLKPFFELMGNPSEWFTDFEDATQLQAWRRLVRDLCRHLIERYGRAEVESWYFECWNEPDCGWWHQFQAGNWNALNNYFDACVTAVKEVNPAFRIGGPGSAKHLSEGFKAFVAHCDNGVNYFTGERGLPIDFISTHVKGGTCNGDFKCPDTDMMFRQKTEQLAYIREQHPRFANLAIIDNECDPIVSWRDPQPWRGRPYYAAVISRILDGHLRVVRDRLGANFEFLGNDNGFMGPWGFRTQLASFGSAEQLKRDQFELIKKPVFNVMTLWALLGDRRLAVSGETGDRPELGAIATRRGDDQVAVLVFHSRDDFYQSGAETVTLELGGLPFEDAIVTHYRIGEDLEHPYRLWLEQGGWRTPEAGLLARLRACQEPGYRHEPARAACPGGRWRATFEMPLHSVDLVLIQRVPARPPARPQGLAADAYAGTNADEQMLLRWDDLECRSLRTYEVLFSATEQGPFTRVNPADLLGTAFMHVRPVIAHGFYRVRGVDVTGRAGAESETLRI